MDLTHPKPTPKAVADRVIEGVQNTLRAEGDRQSRDQRRAIAAGKRALLDAMASAPQKKTSPTQLDPLTMSGLARDLARELKVEEKTAGRILAQAAEDLTLQASRNRLDSRNKGMEQLRAHAEATPAPAVPVYASLDTAPGHRSRAGRAPGSRGR